MSEGQVRPLFIFGIARSGTSLLARVLAAHPAVEIALDPYMPLFKAVRNATIRANAPAALADAFDGAAPFQDGYFAREGYRLLDLLLETDLAAPISPADLARLRPAVASRAAHEAPDLAARASALAGRTCQELMASGLTQVAAARQSDDTRWIGIKEVWVLDFLPALARAFPEARFVAIERDPRAVIASLTALAAEDPSQQAHSISYLRHWRKAIALARRYQEDASLSARFLVLRYEDLAAQPLQSTRHLAAFLDLPFDARMLAPPGLRDGAISGASIDRWRRSLSEATLRTIDFLCAPEMEWAGYRPRAGEGALDDGIIATWRCADRDPGSWRSDSGDVAAELAGELLRWHLLGAERPIADTELVRRCFLFEATYHALHASRRTARHPVEFGRKALS
ncbi:MAG: sulfotransferase [Alphaproteobacteria bacterium]|nr:sulfotransferase [Alphaproteobacteria bacterium]